MAYSFTFDVIPLGGGSVKVVLDEIDAGATSEAEITGMPPVGTVVRQTSTLSSGSAATLDPILGDATDPAGQGAAGVICENATPAATCDNEGSAAYAVAPAASATLYHRSQPNTGTNNVIRTTYLVRAGL